MKIIVGIDSKMEWILPWWWKNYSAHNHFPVTFVDYGMTSEGRTFCKKHGHLTELVNTPNYPNAWFYKPHLMCLPRVSGKVIAIDIDTEIRKSLYPLFDLVRYNSLYAARDVITPKCCKYMEPNFFNGGVIAGYSGTEHTMIWRDYTEEHFPTFRDDQRILSLLNWKNPGFVRPISPKFNRLRLDQNKTDEDVIRHWTGPKGKAIIRQQIETGNL